MYLFIPESDDDDFDVNDDVDDDIDINVDIHYDVDDVDFFLLSICTHVIW